MALYQREGVWWVDIFHQGKRIRKSTGTEVKEDAQRFHDQVKYELWVVKKTKAIPEKNLKITEFVLGCSVVEQLKCPRNWERPYAHLSSEHLIVAFERANDTKLPQ